MNFQALKQQSADVQALADRLSPKSRGENNVLSVGVDAAGHSHCRGRFMPAPEGEEDPVVYYARFDFKNPAGTKSYKFWSRKTIGEKDPAEEFLRALWDSGQKDEYRKYNSKKRWAYNFYVIDDKVKPENNGKMFKLVATKDMHECIQTAFNPKKDPYADEADQPKPFNPFDIFGVAGGRDFVIKWAPGDGEYSTCKGSHYVKESSAFLGGDEVEMEKVWKLCYPLKGAYHVASNFKPYDELKAALMDCLSGNRTLQNLFGSASSLDTSSRQEERRPEPRPQQEAPSEERRQEPMQEQRRADPVRETPKAAPADDAFDFDF